MKAAVVESFGAAPKYREFAGPEAAKGEKLVRVTAAGLHPIVKGLAAGTHYGSTGELPFIAGVDGSGSLMMERACISGRCANHMEHLRRSRRRRTGSR